MIIHWKETKDENELKHQKVFHDARYSDNNNIFLLGEILSRSLTPRNKTLYSKHLGDNKMFTYWADKKIHNKNKIGTIMAYRAIGMLEDVG